MGNNEKKQNGSDKQEQKNKEGSSHFWTTELNPVYTFDEFIVGPNSNFAHAAAWAVAQDPGRKYNPLFLYGGVGLGKTHLMQAVGNSIKETKPDIKILYVSSVILISEVIEAVKSGRIIEFRERYRTLDLLMVDDVQFLAQGEAIQEEFFHTFNILYDNHKQIIMTSDRPPKKLSGIEERLKSRFEWGLTADIKPAGFETRVAILKKKAQNEKINIDEKLLLHIAGKLKSNIRELEGFLKRLSVYASMSGAVINMESIQELIGEFLPEEEKGAYLPEPIKDQEKAKLLYPEAVPGKASEVTPSEIPAAAGTSNSGPQDYSDTDKTSKKPVSIAYFYPEGYEKDFNMMKKQFHEVTEKNKFKFRLEAVFEKNYSLIQKINPLFFAELCTTNKVDIAIILTPPPAVVTESYVFNILPEAFESKGIFAEVVSYGDLMKQYRYLNILLDITLLIR